MKNPNFFPPLSVLLWLLVIFFIALFFASCKKEILENDLSIIKNTERARLSATALNLSTCISDYDAGNGFDSVLLPTILGERLKNLPYSLAKMQQAYLNLTGSSAGVTITNKYVRFKPANTDELAYLDSLDLDLFDYPLDYEIVQLGDYYDDWVTPPEEIPWLYTVVPVGFNAPSGITYEVLQEIHVPQDAEIESEAFRITDNPLDNEGCGGETVAASGTSPQRVPQCPTGQHWDYNLMKCVNDVCPPGYHWDELKGVCMPDYVPPLPGTAPTGAVVVWDNTRPADNNWRPVRKARVIAKRFLKIDRTFTNDLGQYTITKKFNKAHIIVKMKNSDGVVRAVRGIRLWQMIIPVSRNFGLFKGNLSNQRLEFGFNSSAKTDGARFWASSTAHNSLQEFREFATNQDISLPPQNTKIMVTNWFSTGSAPMFAKRFWQTLPTDFIYNFLITTYTPLPPLITNFALVAKWQIDVTVGYNNNGFTIEANYLSETCLHEFAHASHYNKVGNNWWKDFVTAEISEIVGSGAHPYGNGNTSNSPIIALGESWAYHIGHSFTNLKYASDSKDFEDQNITYRSQDLPYLNSNLNLLEGFSPLRTIDPFRWIPTGIYWDMMDNINDDPTPPIDFLPNDQVSNYTNAQFLNALDPDVASMQEFRIRLLNENANNQATEVTGLFSFYNY